MFTIKRYDEPTRYIFVDLDKKKKLEQRKHGVLVTLGFAIVTFILTLMIV